MSVWSEVGDIGQILAQPYRGSRWLRGAQIQPLSSNTARHCSTVWSNSLRDRATVVTGLPFPPISSLASHPKGFVQTSQKA